MGKVRLSLRVGHPSGQMSALLASGRTVRVTRTPLVVDETEITETIRGLNWFVVEPEAERGGAEDAEARGTAEAEAKHGDAAEHGGTAGALVADLRAVHEAVETPPEVKKTPAAKKKPAAKKAAK